MDTGAWVNARAGRFPTAPLCLQRNVCAVGFGGLGEATRLAKSNIVEATIELVRKDVPVGETLPAHNWGRLNEFRAAAL